VSLWGRFQDADESAFMNISADAPVLLGRAFESDGSIAWTIVKTVKRAMAGEYSRELSAKVFAGQCRLIERGFRQGGHAGYGLRRCLVDQNGNRKAILAIGEQKSLQTDRVVLEPGPVEQVETKVVDSDTAISMIRNFIDNVPITHFYSWTLPPGLPPRWAQTHLELFASKVIPAFR
jgi:hypothetical protein